MYLKQTGFPQSLRNLSRRDLNVSPPGGLVTVAVQLLMMLTAERHGKLVADLSSERPRLGKSEVMSVAGQTPTDQAGLCCDKRQMDLVSLADRFLKRATISAGCSPCALVALLSVEASMLSNSCWLRMGSAMIGSSSIESRYQS